MGYAQLGYNVMERFSKLIPSDIGMIERSLLWKENMIMFWHLKRLRGGIKHAKNEDT